MKEVNFSFESLVDSGNVAANGCNAILFINNCNNTPAQNIMYVNGLAIYEGRTLALSCDEGEIDKTVYNVSFSGAGASRDFQVIRKF